MNKEIISKEFEKAYKGLNKSQKTAVDTIEGPVMVVAGPGTGKTTILSLRIAQILLKTDVSPENVLALTFTNSGVLAMRKKLFEYIGDAAYRVNIFTFHSFSEYVIKEFSFYFKELQFSRVVTDIEKVEIIEEIIKNNSFKEIVSKSDIFSSIKTIIDAIKDIKSEGFNPEEFRNLIPDWEKEMFADESILYKRKTGKFNVGDIKPSEKEKIEKRINKAYEISQVFEEYQEILKERGLYDFSDMILNVLNELEVNENLKMDLQEQYQYLLVDEHQDTNFGQNKLIQMLTDAEHLNGRPNLFTVGDEKQSIYRFQGASLENFKYFDSVYNDVQKIALEENYRSTANILDGSHSLILNTSESSIHLNSNRKENNKIRFLEFSNYKFELLKLADDILEKINSGVNPDEIAVIYRSNKNIREVKQVFNHKKISHTIISNEFLLEDINIENIINILRVIHNPNDDYNLSKILFVNFLNFDPFDVVKILDKYSIHKRKTNDHLIDILDSSKLLESFNIKNIEAFIELKEKIKSLKTQSLNDDFENFLKDFLNEIGYMNFMLASDDGQDQLIKLDKLFDEIKKQKQNNKNYNIGNFLKFIDSYKKYNLDIETSNPEILSGVKLMTAHKSKGLEFEYVYIINAVRNGWENKRGFSGITLPIKNFKGDINDERRLFYVAMTRAKKELWISYSKNDWQGKEQEKTQFINEIQYDFIKKEEVLDFEKNNLKNLDIFIKNSKQPKNIFDKDYLNNLFLNKKLSVTALNNYIDCPIKYLFRNLIQLPSSLNPHQIFGNVIHNTLEEYFNDSVTKEEFLSKKDLLKKFQNHIINSSIPDHLFEKYKAEGENILTEYYDTYHSTWNLNIDTEKRFTQSFMLNDDQEILLTGILDKIEYLDSKIEGRINIIDYKTGKPYSEKSKKSQKEDLERQLIFYHILLKDYHEGKLKVENAILDFVEKNKKGEYEQLTVSVDSEKIEKMFEAIKDMANDVLSGEFLSKGCCKDDCEYCDLYNSIK